MHRNRGRNVPPPGGGPDIAGPGSDVLGTRQLAECIAEEAAELASETRKIA